MTDVARLIREIELAFEGVVLGDGVSLNLCEYYDSGGTDKERLNRAESDERFDWHKVISDELPDFGVTFCFTDAQGYRFYLPAYMIWTLRNFRSSSALICDMTVYAVDPERDEFKKAPFTDKQLDALVHFLEFACEVEELDYVVGRENLIKLRAFRDRTR